MRRTRVVNALVATVVGVTGLTGCTASINDTADSGARYVIKYTSPDPASEPQAAQINHFADMVKKDSHGQIAVKAYFDGVLATSAGGVSLVSNGSAEMTYANAPDMAAYISTYNFLQEPMLFTDQGKISKGLASKQVRSLDAKFLDKTGIRVLGWGALGFIDLLNGHQQIHSASDMKNLRFRIIPGSGPVIDAMKSLGAQPVPLDITEVYTALEQRTIDGNLDPTTTFYPSKQWEVAKYLTIMPFQYNPMPILINDKFFKKLPANLQATVARDAAKTAAWEVADQNSESVKDIELMRQSGVHVSTLSDSGIETFNRALSSVRRKAYREYGPELFSAFGITP